jgi:type IV fimbrial biogenesis protein FimT
VLSISTNKISRHKGFTLIELLVVVGIVAITMGVGMPGFQSTIASSRLTSSANNMVVALLMARSEAVKKNILAGVTINTGMNGWSVFSSTTSNTTQEYAVDSGVTLTITTPTSGNTTPTYQPNGRVNNGTTYVMQFSALGSDETRILTLQSSGRVSVCTPVLPSTSC